jgi:hypothetical protein
MRVLLIPAGRPWRAPCAAALTRHSRGTLTISQVRHVHAARGRAARVGVRLGERVHRRREQAGVLRGRRRAGRPRTATSAPGLGSPRHICTGTEWAHPGHICAGTALAPHHICTGTGVTPATSAPGSFPPLHTSAGVEPIAVHICAETGLAPAPPMSAPDRD